MLWIVKLKRLIRLLGNWESEHTGIRGFVRRRIRRVKLYGFRALYDAEYHRRMYLARHRERSPYSPNPKKTKINRRKKEKYGNAFLKKGLKFKTILLHRDGNNCFWCHKPFIAKDITIDHIKPVSQGGEKKDLSNMRLIHDKCRVKRDKLIARGAIEIIKQI